MAGEVRTKTPDIAYDLEVLADVLDRYGFGALAVLNSVIKGIGQYLEPLINENQAA